MTVIVNPFQLLELHIISAQDLAHVSRSIRPYAVTWIHPDRKLSTRVDHHGKTNPSWNDRFVFKVDDDFLCSETSAVTVEIYSSHWLKDILIGTVRVIVGNLLPPMSSQLFSRQQNVGMQFAALLVRRPSGRPQGILNVGVTLLNSSRQSMPLHSEISTSVTVTTTNNDEPRSIVSGNIHDKPSHELCRVVSVGGSIIKPMLMRSKSESRSMEVMADDNKLKRKVSFRERLHSIISASEGSSSQDQKLLKGSSSTPASMVNSYYVSHPNENANPDKRGESGNKTVAHGTQSGAVKVTELNEAMMLVDLRDPAMGTKGPNSRKMMTKLEVGLSVSEVVVAAATKKRLLYGAVAMEKSIVTVTESAEGLQSKLERWRMELPKIYDMSDITSFGTSEIRSGGGGKVHGRRHTDGGSEGGLFSCFSNICGCECSIVCGGNGGGKDMTPLKSRRRQRRHSHSPHSDSYLL